MPFNRDEPGIDIYRSRKRIARLTTEIAHLKAQRESASITHLEAALGANRQRVVNLRQLHAESLARTEALRAKLKGHPAHQTSHAGAHAIAKAQGGGFDEGKHPRDDHGRWTNA